MNITNELVRIEIFINLSIFWFVQGATFPYHAN